MARMFVAVWPSQEALDALSGLTRPGYPDLRWTPPERCHATLRFFGNVETDDVPAVCDALQHAVARRLPCRAVLGPSTVRLGRSVLAVPVAGLDELGTAVVDATRWWGRPPEDRPFVGHLTVARGRGGRPVPTKAAGQAVQGAWDVTGVTLVSSRLGPDGPTYDVVFTTLEDST